MTIPLRNGPGGKRDRKKYPGHVTFGTMPPRSGLFYASPQLGPKSPNFYTLGVVCSLADWEEHPNKLLRQCFWEPGRRLERLLRLRSESEIASKRSWNENERMSRGNKNEEHNDNSTEKRPRGQERQKKYTGNVCEHLGACWKGCLLVTFGTLPPGSENENAILSQEIRMRQIRMATA